MGREDGERIVEQRGEVDPGRRLQRFDADDEVELGPAEALEQRGRRGHREMELDVGSGQAVVAEDVAEVVGGGGVDEAEPDPAGAAAATTVDPAGEVVGGGDRGLGVAEDLGVVAGRDTPATVALEQREPEPAFQFGDPLGEGRRRDAGCGCGFRPRRRPVDGDQVLELLGGEHEPGHPRTIVQCS